MIATSPDRKRYIRRFIQGRSRRQSPPLILPSCLTRPPSRLDSCPLLGAPRISRSRLLRLSLQDHTPVHLPQTGRHLCHAVSSAAQFEGELGENGGRQFPWPVLAILSGLHGPERARTATVLEATRYRPLGSGSALRAQHMPNHLSTTSRNVEAMMRLSAQSQLTPSHQGRQTLTDPALLLVSLHHHIGFAPRRPAEVPRLPNTRLTQTPTSHAASLNKDDALCRSKSRYGLPGRPHHVMVQTATQDGRVVFHRPASDADARPARLSGPSSSFGSAG